MAPFLLLRVVFRLAEISRFQHFREPVHDTVFRAEAIRLIRRLRGQNEPVMLGVDPDTAGSYFREAVARAGIEDLHFHDSRHEATTRLAKKLHVLDLARVAGHRDIKQLQTYYNRDAEELADLL